MESGSKDPLLQSPKVDFISYWEEIPVDILSLLIDYLDELKDVYKFLSDLYVKEKLCRDENNRVWESKFKRDFSEYIILDELTLKKYGDNMTIMKKYLSEREYFKYILKAINPTSTFIFSYIMETGFEKLFNKIDMTNIPRSSLNGYLIRSVSLGYLHMIKILIKYGAIITDQCFHVACNGNIAIVKFLHENGCDLKNQNTSEILKNAILNDKMDIVEYLIKNGVNIKSVRISRYELEECIKRNELSIIKFIYSNNIIIDSDYNNNYLYDHLLYKAIQYHNINIFKILYQHSTNINKEELLCNAVREKDNLIVDLLIENGADILETLKYCLKNYDYHTFVLLSELYHSHSLRIRN